MSFFTTVTDFGRSVLDFIGVGNNQNPTPSSSSQSRLLSDQQQKIQQIASLQLEERGAASSCNRGMLPHPFELSSSRLQNSIMGSQTIGGSEKAYINKLVSIVDMEINDIAIEMTRISALLEAAEQDDPSVVKKFHQAALIKLSNRKSQLQEELCTLVKISKDGQITFSDYECKVRQIKNILQVRLAKLNISTDLVFAHQTNTDLSTEFERALVEFLIQKPVRNSRKEFYVKGLIPSMIAAKEGQTLDDVQKLFRQNPPQGLAVGGVIVTDDNIQQEIERQYQILKGRCNPDQFPIIDCLAVPAIWADWYKIHARMETLLSSANLRLKSAELTLELPALNKLGIEISESCARELSALQQRTPYESFCNVDLLPDGQVQICGRVAFLLVDSKRNSPRQILDISFSCLNPYNSNPEEPDMKFVLELNPCLKLPLGLGWKWLASSQLNRQINKPWYPRWKF